MAIDQPTLVILAAGMGSRYGGLKQLDPIGPHGETLLDYSVFDALRAGFGRIVFVIRRDFSDLFQAQVVTRYAGSIDVVCVFQELHHLPAGFELPASRVKPWGTVHAVIAARAVLNGFFAVINADDFYGRQAYQQMFEHHQDWVMAGCRPEQCAMVAYPIRNTLSSHGGVNRGICLVQDGQLVSVEEVLDIRLEHNGRCRGHQLDGHAIELDPEALVSMNFWGLTPAVLSLMAKQFADFLHQRGTEEASECYIPTVMDQLIRSHQATCRVLPTVSAWFGVTYREDKTACAEAIQRLVQDGSYPRHLWS